LLLNFLTLAVFGFAEDDYAGKLGYIATLFLGLVAFIPSIRSGLPNLPSQTLLEKQIYVTVVLLAFGLLNAVGFRILEVNGIPIVYTGNGTTGGLIINATTFTMSACITAASICFWGWRIFRFKRSNPLDPIDVPERKQDSAEFSLSDWYPAEEWRVERKKLPLRSDIYFDGYKYDNKPKKGKKDDYYDDYGYYRM